MLLYTTIFLFIGPSTYHPYLWMKFLLSNASEWKNWIIDTYLHMGDINRTFQIANKTGRGVFDYIYTYTCLSIYGGVQSAVIIITSGIIKSARLPPTSTASSISLKCFQPFEGGIKLPPRQNNPSHRGGQIL